MPASDEPANPDPDRDGEPDERRERWTYAGARWDGKLHHAWWDGSELLHYRKRLVTVSVGGQAELSVRRSADRITVMTDPAQPNRALATRLDNADLVHRWAAADLAAVAERDQKSLQRKAQRIEPLDDLLRPLQHLAPQLTTPQRRALAIRILQALHL